MVDFTNSSTLSNGNNLMLLVNYKTIDDAVIALYMEMYHSKRPILYQMSYL